MTNKIIQCKNIEISNNNKITLIAGPCQLETEQHAMDMAGKIKEISGKFKKGFKFAGKFECRLRIYSRYIRNIYTGSLHCFN